MDDGDVGIELLQVVLIGCRVELKEICGGSCGLDPSTRGAPVIWLLNLARAAPVPEGFNSAAILQEKECQLE